MTKFAYVRISTAEQNELRQVIAMEDLKIPKENIYMDKLSGKNTARPGLQKLLATVKQGDVIYVESFSRFARNTRDLLDLVEQLSEMGVGFVSLKEKIDTGTPTGKFMLTVFAGIAELERAFILQRSREGIEAARRAGKHLGRPVKNAPDDFDTLVKDWERKVIPLSKVLEQCGSISESTFYRRRREHRIIKGKK
ncbi:MAG: recombinase family protein [Oscillospiraceae bacterium]|jgi:DNA invertase Pin-like site-specific DNA recombinase|nr:recombinase family protein [Oscillospiraceae bacterium]